MTIVFPDRIELARTPTPLQHLPRTSDYLGVEFFVKRDDLTGAELSGNKVRKLEFIFAEVLARGADTVITCGGEQSNHCRATALAAARLGLRSLLLLRTKDPKNPPAATGNILLDQMAGAEILWISYDEYARRNEIFERESERLIAAGRRPYTIVEGGSSAVGAWGYVGCALELTRDLAELAQASTTVVYACGSGGTGAGLVLGAKMFGLGASGVQVAGINVCDDRDYFTRVIGHICNEFDVAYHAGAEVTRADIEIVEGYVGLGYAQSQDKELREIAAMAKRDAIILDPVYSGKAFFGLVQELRRDPRRFGERVVFVHTGGIFGLFPAAERISKLLPL